MSRLRLSWSRNIVEFTFDKQSHSFIVLGALSFPSSPQSLLASGTLGRLFDRFQSSRQKIKYSIVFVETYDAVPADSSSLDQMLVKSHDFARMAVRVHRDETSVLQKPG